MAFFIIRNEIINVPADAIVKEIQYIGDVEPGCAEKVPSFYMRKKHFINTVAPTWIDGEHGEKDIVRNCYENSLNLAHELGCESIAFPLIGSGAPGFSKADAIQVAISVFRSFLNDHDMQINLVLPDDSSLKLSEKIFPGVDEYIDKNYISVMPDEDDFLIGASCSMPSEYIPDENVAEERAPYAQLSEPKKSRNMFKKPTSKQKRSLDDIMAHLGDTWQETLFRLIDEKSYTDTEVYKRANVDRKLFSKIRSNPDYQPKKITAIAFALALKLNHDETKDFLKRAGYALSPSSRFDLIIEYFIEQEVYDIYTINLALFEHDQHLLGE